jgi:N-glycosylase/DNA lyase
MLILMRFVKSLDASLKIQLDRLITPFDLEHTLRCGQLFRWRKLSDWWYGVVSEKVVKIRQIEDELRVQTFPEEMDTDFVKNYFRLDDNLSHILSRISIDEHIRKAIQCFSGLRIIRQQPWECLVSYICATYKSIPAIKEMVLSLSKRFGTKITFDGYDFYTFPKPSDLANTDVEELRKCKLGFRDKRVLKTARIMHNEELDLEALRKSDYEHARNELLSLPGVGQKVADCVLLFSLDKLEAFPVDVWLKRIILKYYSSHFEPLFIEKIQNKRSLTPHEYREINLFGRRYFGRYAGYAQEYLFHYERQQPR